MKATHEIRLTLDSELRNKVTSQLKKYTYFSGIIGEKPSQYSRSPGLWNAVFKKTGIDAVYVPFDVEKPRLKTLLQKLRCCPNFLGTNITVPYKTSVMGLLDRLDEKAKRIGAVNAVVRTPQGRLIGHNTDGLGAVASLTERLSHQDKPFMKSLAGRIVLLLGAGGSAKAVAFSLGKKLGRRGQLWISNRSVKRAQSLALSVNKTEKNCRWIPEKALETVLAKADLIINATTKGQSNFEGEAYSALGPMFVERSKRLDLQRNKEISKRRLSLLKSHAKLFDVIYSPEETIFLKEGRRAGHPTLNGKGMIIFQALEAFSLMTKALAKSGKKQREEALKSMVGAW